MAYAEATVPDLVPARTLNEYAYCPRLRWSEWGEENFVTSADAVKGMLGYRRMERGQGSIFKAYHGAPKDKRNTVDTWPAREDQTVFFTLGHADGFKAEATLALGRPYVFIERHAIVV